MCQKRGQIVLAKGALFFPHHWPSYFITEGRQSMPPLSPGAIGSTSYLLKKHQHAFLTGLLFPT